MIITKRSRTSKNVITKEYGLLTDFDRYFDIAKIDEEKRVVEGIMTKATIDNQEEIVDWNGTKEAIKEFMKFGNVREMHRSDSAAGTVVDYKIDEKNKLIKVWAKIVDDKAWEKVKEGVYKGFSIGGKALKRVKEFVPELGKVVSIVKKYLLNELSLVDRPAHPECIFTMVKRAGNYNDPLINEVASNKRKLDMFESKIMTDEEIRKLDDSSFGLIKRVKSGRTIFKKRYFAMPDRVHAQAVLNILEHSDLSKKDKFTVHNRAAKILGKRHKSNKCSYCILIQKCQEGSKLAKRRNDKLAQASELLEEVREDMEGNAPGPDQVESEDLRPAKQRVERDSSMGDFEGPEAGEGEYYPYEVDEDGEPIEDEEGWDGYTGHETGTPPETARTHTLDPEAYRRGKKRPIDGEDQEGELDEDYGEEDEEDDEVGKSCPYCRTTMNLAAESGQMRKGGSIECPGCGTIYDIGSAPHVSVQPRVQKGETQEGDIDVDVLVEELQKRDEMIDRLCDKVEGLKGSIGRRPFARKGAITKGSGKIERPHEEEEDDDEDAEVEKQDKEIKVNMEKAVSLRKMAQQTGKSLSPEDEAFCQNALDARLGKVAGE